MKTHELILTDDQETLVAEIAKLQGKTTDILLQEEIDSRLNDVIERNLDAAIGAGNMPYMRAARIKAAAELVTAKSEVKPE
jgi:hypothetical protein